MPQTTTRVQVTVEVIDNQPWDAETKVSEIYKRAREDALQQVQNTIRGGDLKIDRSGVLRIVGEPFVSLVIASAKP